MPQLWVIFVLFLAAFGGALSIRTFKCSGSFNGNRVLDSDCSTRLINDARTECIMQKWASCWTNKRIKLNKEHPHLAYPPLFEPQLLNPAGGQLYRGGPSSEKKILEKMFRTGKINAYQQQGTDGSVYGVELPQHADGEGFQDFELMMLDLGKLLATNKAFRNAYFSIRLASVDRGAAFGGSTLQYLWNSLHHKDLKKLKEIMEKYNFFQWIDDNLEIDEARMFPGNVLRTLERHMFRCRGYFGVPSHYEIPMCYYGRWSAELFASCKLTHWRNGPEANAVLDFTSFINPNVQAYKTFLQQTDPYVDGGNAFVRVFKFPDDGIGQGAFVWKKYSFDFFMAESGLAVKNMFKNPLPNNEFEILTLAQACSMIEFNGVSCHAREIHRWNRVNRAAAMRMVQADKWKSLKGVFITMLCHDNPIFSKRWGTPAECMTITWSASRGPGLTVKNHFINSRTTTVGLLASMPFGVALRMPSNAALNDPLNPSNIGAGTWQDELIGRMYMEQESLTAKCPISFLDSLS